MRKDSIELIKVKIQMLEAKLSENLNDVHRNTYQLQLDNLKSKLGKVITNCFSNSRDIINC